MPINRIQIKTDWKFKQQNKDEWFPASVPGCVHTDLLVNKKIDDPFFRTNERKLQWIDKVNWEYQTKFKVDSDILKNKHQRLIFEGLDTYADAYLNGIKIIEANNMFRRWTADVKGILQNENELKVIFRSPINEDIPKYNVLDYNLPAINDQSEVGELGDKCISVFARKAPYHYGWDWGPRFVTMGIWRPVYLESWDEVIIESIYYQQDEVNDKTARISAIIEINSDHRQSVYITINNQIDGVTYISKESVLQPGIQWLRISFEIDNPKLWWCNGLGEANLYTFNIEISIGNNTITKKETKIGLRSIKVIRKKDEKGRSFYFELNGKPVFARGANYIPNDNFITRVTSSKYEHIIRSAADANLNMLRVWGGGIYENDIFYELCDQHGILIWQDFMFACSMYPGDEDFLSNVKQEIIDNIKRLRNHACIAIWCGNNENDWIWHMDDENGWKNKFKPEIAKKLWVDYGKLFYDLIPQLVKELDFVRFYWPSSPMGEYDERSSYTKTSGDMHYWGVWHNKEPFENFKKYPARFMSEYGFQSFPELATVKKFTSAEDRDIDSEVMAAHQRSGIGNQLIKMYMNWEYHVPDNFPDLLYLSQVLQAEGIKTGMEAQRRSKPYCMGSLYWQINDCWPAASWSSIDYYGRWKALHFFAKKAFNPVLISPDFDGENIYVHVISDLQEALNCSIVLELLDFTGNKIWINEQTAGLRENDNQIVFKSRLNEILKDKKKNNVVMHCACYQKDRLLSENRLYFDRTKNLDLPKPEIKIDLYNIKSGYEISLISNMLVKNLFLSHGDEAVFFSDNYFDLIPGKPVQINCTCNLDIKDFKNKFKMISVYDTYHH
ncbi:MAG: glycoside hydrolase family 2 protein [Calditrichaceae bacterium]|nr:glycoside hydrolase family 2 protein [Calditrichaceae bacterium]